MGECLSSGTLVFEERERPYLPCTLTLEFWDRDYPDDGDEPRINFTAEDQHFDYAATAGLKFEQVRELRDSLTRWLDSQDAPRDSQLDRGGQQ